MKKYIGRIIAIGCVAAALAYGHILECARYELESDKINAPVKLAFLSDVHNSWYGSGQKELVDKIAEFGADIVLFGGDLFDERNGENNSWTLVDALVAEYPCFYTIGNHEIKTGKPLSYIRQMAEHGVTVLDNNSKTITVNEQKLCICGLDKVKEGAIEELSEDKSDAFSILLYHYPQDYPLLSDKGFDLILAGHAHGGQWRIPGLINGLYAPDEGLFPKYAGGRYEENGSTMIVSRGLYRQLSCILIPRIFNNPELVLITLN